jgi:hypothetical protein
MSDVVMVAEMFCHGDNSYIILFYFFRSGKTDQIFLTTQGFLTSAYHYVQCPVPVLKWLFRVREMFEGL